MKRRRDLDMEWFGKRIEMNDSRMGDDPDDDDDEYFTKYSHF